MLKTKFVVCVLLAAPPLPEHRSQAPGPETVSWATPGRGVVMREPMC